MNVRGYASRSSRPSLDGYLGEVLPGKAKPFRTVAAAKPQSAQFQTSAPGLLTIVLFPAVRRPRFG